MKILHISDLHCKNSDYIEVINSIDIKDKNIDIVVCCGDILDKGQNVAAAENILQTIKTKFDSLQIIICPGNHDICDKENDAFANFNEIAKNFFNFDYNFDDDSVFVISPPDLNYNFIIANSVFHKDYRYGSIDYCNLENKLKAITSSKENILIFHHALFSCDDNDVSSLRDIPELINIINRYNIKFILHGHTHSFSLVNLNEKCSVIGVGPLLTPSENINSQYNIVEIFGGELFKITNYRYHADIKEFTSMTSRDTTNFTHFKSSSALSLIKNINKFFNEKNHLINCIFSIKMRFDDFAKEISEELKEYLEKAQLWQNNECPNVLWFNHGEKINTYFSTFGNELKNKPTTSRAIMSLVDMNDILNKNEYIPSFDLVQVGFDIPTEELNINLYMRAVEVKNFLPINICELYIIIKKLKTDYTITFDKININIFAFRAQSIQGYNCFMKAELDRCTEAELTSFFFNKEIVKIVNILKDKKGSKESIVHIEGVQSLYNAFKAYKKIHREKSFETLIQELKTLQEYQKKYTLEREIKEQRQIIETAFDNIIKMIEGISDEFSRAS